MEFVDGKRVGDDNCVCHWIQRPEVKKMEFNDFVKKEYGGGHWCYLTDSYSIHSLEKAWNEAQRWWKSSQGDRWRAIGGAKCDADSSHRISPGQGYLCKPRRPGDSTPDLVCERCFNAFAYEPWEPTSAGGGLMDAEIHLLAQNICKELGLG